MDQANTKPAVQSMGIVAPAVGVGVWAMRQFGGYVVPDEVQVHLVTIADYALPVLLAMAIEGRRRAKAVIDRWWR